MRNSSQSTLTVSRQTGEPSVLLAQWIDSAADGAVLLVDFELHQWWLENKPLQPLVAIYSREGDQTLYAVTDQVVTLTEFVPYSRFRDWASRRQLAVLRPGQALGLQPTRIPKPWGQEVWFTGVEERGVCCYTDGQYATPIPWAQAAAPGVCAGASGEPLVLLKVLDPAPEEVVGDLYFELHEEKREVYVVTHVDSKAWPEGSGGIRYGFDSERLAEAESEAAFRHEYLQAVRDYERVRRQIDGLSSGTLVPQSLRDEEKARREAMNSFTHMRSLEVGDVVVVPLLMPHSLQHGVRTIEFQTPVYERQILSFAQKVLTQDHWDTESAVQQMRLTPPPDAAFELLPSEDGVVIERIVDFPDFEVLRVAIVAGGAMTLQGANTYQLLMLIEGRLELDGLQLGAENAAFLPSGQVFQFCCSDPSQPLVLLLALPRS
ncbi:MAG: hypothetical protein ABJL54_11235 [Halioglobus sp.]